MGYRKAAKISEAEKRRFWGKLSILRTQNANTCMSPSHAAGVTSPLESAPGSTPLARRHTTLKSRWYYVPLSPNSRPILRYLLWWLDLPAMHVSRTQWYHFIGSTGSRLNEGMTLFILHLLYIFTFKRHTSRLVPNTACFHDSVMRPRSECRGAQHN